MASNGNSRRWIIVGLIAFGVVLAATLPRSGSDEAEEGESDSADTSEREEESTVTKYDPDGGKATRRIAEGCDPIAEAKKYEELVDRRALATLSWNNMRERAAKLEIPVYVKSIEDGAIGVGILEIPMREQYLAIWMMSGHLKRGSGDTYLLDPCSAKVIAWEAMDRLHPPSDDDDEEANE
jgi:hypothetical protein